MAYCGVGADDQNSRAVSTRTPGQVRRNAGVSQPPPLACCQSIRGQLTRSGRRFCRRDELMIIKGTPPRRLTLGALLGRGYFPPELPPPFKTASFANAVRLARTPSLPQEFTKQKNDWCGFVSYSLSRPGSLRRRLAIVNPLAYFRLARFIVANQQAILKKAGASDLSIGKPVVGLFGRLRRSAGYDAVPLQRALLRIGHQFLLVADISRFYPSMYTHSIDWAMSSKTRAKRQLSRRSKKLSVGASLDRLVQACQSGQTRGIPIGPAASMLLSELVLAKVDGRLKAQKITTGFRYADDYELSFSERSHAERALAVLEDALAEFELELNPAKTDIAELPQELDNQGIQELRRFRFRSAYQAERSDLMHFFTRAFTLHRGFKDRPILRYAVSRLPARTVKPANASLTQALILQAVAYESGVWPMAIDKLLEIHNAHQGLSTADIGVTVHSMIRKCAHLNHSSEVAWSLWAALVFKIKVTKAAVKAVSAMADDCSSLLLFHAAQLGLTAVKPAQNTATCWFSAEALRGSHWLLAYEPVVQGWVAPTRTPDHISTDPVFAYLRKNNVRFYDTHELTRTVEGDAESEHETKAKEDQQGEAVVLGYSA